MRRTSASRSLRRATLANAGPVNEGEFTFYLDEVCVVTSATKMSCPIMKRGADGTWTDAGTQVRRSS